MKKNMYDGLRVLDLTNNFAGPVSTAFLADYGAEVIHVEKPVLGDDNRHFVPKLGGESSAHIASNRGKKSLVLDLKDPRAIEILRKLIVDTDIIVESFRPGVLEKLGLGYEAVKEITPDIIYCSVSAYGQTGPYAQRPGYDIIAQAVSGFMNLTGDPDGRPVNTNVAITDWMAGMNAFGCINVALHYRDVTGEGQHVDISLVRTLAWACSSLDFMYTGKVAKRSGAHNLTMCPYGIFNGNNGESIIIATLSSNLWGKLCKLIGREELIQDPRFVTNDKRCENLGSVVEVIESWLKTFDSIKTAEAQLLGAGIPCGRVYDPVDTFEDPHFNEAGWITEIPLPDNVKGIPTKYVFGQPFGFSAVKPEYKKAPVLGADNRELLGRVGYSEEEADALLNEWNDAVKQGMKKA